MKSIHKYFYGSYVSFAIGIVLGYLIAGFQGAYIVAILSVLETSLSLDNAVVNAQVLKNWDARWRHYFLVYGLPVAVFGMRLVFPIVIVSMTTGLGSLDVLQMAIARPDDYARALTSVHHEVAAFGGGFLLMVFFKFFVDLNKDTHWLHPIEAPLTKLGKIESVQAALTMILIFYAASFLTGEEHNEFIFAGFWGIVVYILSKGFGSLMSGEEEEGVGNIVKQGILGLLYLEILDASFSFDGVIGAFALSNNIFIIAIGLGVGAMFVRSLTIYLVDKGVLEELRYLEHGAFWAIGTLAVIMLFGVNYHIPEVVTGLIGAVLIGLAYWHSHYLNKKEEQHSKTS